MAGLIVPKPYHIEKQLDNYFRPTREDTREMKEFPHRNLDINEQIQFTPQLYKLTKMFQ